MRDELELKLAEKFPFMQQKPMLEEQKQNGTLRFYYDIKGQEQAIHAFDFLGQGSLRFTDKSTPLYKEISNIVRKYETKSATVCEKCGKADKKSLISRRLQEFTIKTLLKISSANF